MKRQSSKNSLCCRDLKPKFGIMKEKTHRDFDSLLPELMTEEELIQFLRIPTVSKAEDYSNVIANLKRMRDLPYIHICRQPLYPRESIRRWIREQTEKDRVK